jgi:ATP-binding cassette, subfamily C (CFTR/MRP), member 1
MWWKILGYFRLLLKLFFLFIYHYIILNKKDPKAIYSSQPDFTFCFHNTVLLWMPCAVLWLVAPLWIYMLTRQSEGKIRISWILISKSIVTILLISIETIRIIRAYNRNEHLLVYFLTPYILIMTYILVLFLIHFERLRNLKSSTLVFIFFGLLTLDSIVTLRSKIIHYLNHKSHDTFELYLFIAFFVLICMNTILTLFSEQDVTNYDQVINKDDTSSRLKKMPENNVSLMSKLWFWWINDLIKTGFKRDLVRDDLWEIDDSETSIVITKRLENAWNQKANDYINKIREHPELDKPVKIKKTKENNKKLKKENYKNGNKSEEEIKLNVTDL